MLLFVTLSALLLQRYDPVTTGIGSLLVTGYCVVAHQQSVGEALNIAACATVLGMVRLLFWAVSYVFKQHWSAGHGTAVGCHPLWPGCWPASHVFPMPCALWVMAVCHVSCAQYVISAVLNSLQTMQLCGRHPNKQ
jgi:hypothetical protein